jgi:hypothetical protein
LLSQPPGSFGAAASNQKVNGRISRQCLANAGTEEAIATQDQNGLDVVTCS